MSKTNITLTKTCASCGIEKPLSAFLQLSDHHGAIYGTICASCRKSFQVKAKDQDEQTTSTTGVKIDSKSRIHEEISKKQFKHDTDEQYHEKREENQQLTEKHAEKTKLILKKEKEHRKSHLEKRSFFDTSRQTNTSKTNPVVGSSEQATLEARFDAKDTYTSKTKQSSLAHLAMKSRLGLSSPIISAAERAAALVKKETDKETPVDFIRKNWKK